MVSASGADLVMGGRFIFSLNYSRRSVSFLFCRSEVVFLTYLKQCFLNKAPTRVARQPTFLQRPL